MQWDETDVQFETGGTSGRFATRVVGDKRREAAASLCPVLIVPTAGASYEYMETLEALVVSDRRVVEPSFAGTRGRVDPALTSPSSMADQLRALVRQLQLPAVHLLAHGAGASAALQLVEGEGSLPLRSLTLLSPYGSLADLKQGVDPKSLSTLLPTLDAKARGSCITESIGTSSPAWLEALGREGGGESLRGEKLPRLLQPAAKAKVATLVMWGGDRDIVDTSWPIDSLQKENVNLRVFEQSGHLPFIDEREAFVAEYLEFLDAVDGKKTSRELLIDPSLKSIRGTSI
ncbi:MAG: hypothetical protein SGPRY_006275 [Prymnesium sp.]